MIEGKSEFYSKAQESLMKSGYTYYDGDRDIPGKGRSHANKPDYIAIKNGIIVIGEIKSPKEGPKSSSWRQIQNSDSEEFKKVRLDVLRREKVGKLAPEIGGHEIIIRGKIPDYIRKIGKTYDLPSSIHPGKTILAGYSFPKEETCNVEQALKNTRKKVVEKIDTENGSVTFIF